MPRAWPIAQPWPKSTARKIFSADKEALSRLLAAFSSTSPRKRRRSGEHVAAASIADYRGYARQLIAPHLSQADARCLRDWSPRLQAHTVISRVMAYVASHFIDCSAFSMGAAAIIGLQLRENAMETSAHVTRKTT